MLDRPAKAEAETQLESQREPGDRHALGPVRSDIGQNHLGRKLPDEGVPKGAASPAQNVLQGLVPPAALRLLRPASAGGKAQAFQHSRQQGSVEEVARIVRQIRKSWPRGPRHPAPIPACPRGADGLVRAKPRRLCLRGRPQRAACNEDRPRLAEACRGPRQVVR